MGYTNICKISEMIFPFCAALVRPKLKYWPCFVLGNLERRWPTGKSPDEGNKINHRFYDQNLSKLGALQVKKEGLFSYTTKLFLSTIPRIWARTRSKQINLWQRRSRLEVQKNLVLWGCWAFVIEFQEQLDDQGWLVQLVLPWAGLWGWKTCGHFIC